MHDSGNRKPISTLKKPVSAPDSTRTILTTSLPKTFQFAPCKKRSLTSRKDRQRRATEGDVIDKNHRDIRISSPYFQSFSQGRESGQRRRRELGKAKGDHVILRRKIPSEGRFEDLVAFAVENCYVELLKKCIVGYRLFIGFEQFCEFVEDWIDRCEWEDKSVIKEGVCYWLDVSPDDFDKERLTKFSLFVGRDVSVEVEYKRESEDQFLTENCTVDELAHRLCIYDQSLINKITCKILFEDPDRISHHTNLITRWAAESIIGPTSPKARAHMISYFIELAQTLRKLKNYNSLFAIVNALTLFPVTRLRKTWKKVPKQKITSLSKLEALCSPQANFSELQKKIQSTQSRSIPFLLPMLVNISRITETIHLDGEKETIKVSKLKSYHIIFNNLMRYQCSQCLADIEHIQLEETDVLCFEMLETLSISRE
eukprot:TRINITY_DN796_c0_g1_i2.p1 TRINITY_DN796_c0_g1~~TRINITY_DN796_c0_g1_i2.p1  ORF type:complete len:428 (-),score=60.27 TRINITY_DN796_c0_g1_i2:225-1508(-)